MTEELSTYCMRHVSKNGAKLAKHMTALTMPDHPELDKPVRKYITASGMAATERTIISTKLVAGLTSSDASTVLKVLMVKKPFVAESDWAMKLKKYNISF